MEGMFDNAGDGYPMVDLDSDQERGEDSSEDDLDIILHGTPEQKRRLRRISLGQNSSSEDEFEKEMGTELTATMNKLREAAKIKGSSSKPKENSNDAGGEKEQFYSKEYFDSDSDDDMNSSDKKKSKHPVIADEDLFYDPDMDRQDELWVEGQRQYRNVGKPKQQKKKGSKKDGGTYTDAVLNCPACMSLLSLDCQRHDFYKNQYRAMFVKNCSVNMAERLRYPIGNNKKKRKKVQLKSPLEDLESIDGSAKDSITMTASPESVPPEAAGSSSQRTDEVFYPVKCSVCNSEVGVYDEDEVYHFFNVLASHS